MKEATMNLITQKRKEKRLTKTSLAQLIGVSESTVSRWENGKIHSIKNNKILLLAKTLGLTLEDLAGLVL